MSLGYDKRQKLKILRTLADSTQAIDYIDVNYIVRACSTRTHSRLRWLRRRGFVRSNDKPDWRYEKYVITEKGRGALEA